VSLQTPDSVRRLQRALYVKAKKEPAYRFYLLYDKVYRDDILRHAYQVSRTARGARTPGVDGVTFADIEAAGQDEWLAGLKRTLQEKTYQPDAVRRVLIPKPGGGERPLGIPTIRDRVVQTAVKLGWRRDAAPAERGPQRGSRAGGPECSWSFTTGC
jgi:RNA-directed DNA polymerase